MLGAFFHSVGFSKLPRDSWSLCILACDYCICNHSLRGREQGGAAACSVASEPSPPRDVSRYLGHWPFSWWPHSLLCQARERADISAACCLAHFGGGGGGWGITESPGPSCGTYSPAEGYSRSFACSTHLSQLWTSSKSVPILWRKSPLCCKLRVSHFNPITTLPGISHHGCPSRGSLLVSQHHCRSFLKCYALCHFQESGAGTGAGVCDALTLLI